jgi:hypothetical protein
MDSTEVVMRRDVATQPDGCAVPTRAITMLAGYADGSKSTEIRNAVRYTVDWLNTHAAAPQARATLALPDEPDHEILAVLCGALPWEMQGNGNREEIYRQYAELRRIAMKRGAQADVAMVDWRRAE